MQDNTENKIIDWKNISNSKIKENLMSLFFGNKLARRNLPTVLVYFSNFIFPFSSTVSNLDIILEWTFMLPDSKPCSISELFTKYPSTFSV